MSDDMALNDRLLADAGSELINTGMLIRSAHALQNAALLDWKQICAYTVEMLFQGAEAIGFDHEEVAPEMLRTIESNRVTSENYKKRKEEEARNEPG